MEFLCKIFLLDSVCEFEELLVRHGTNLSLQIFKQFSVISYDSYKNDDSVSEIEI